MLLNFHLWLYLTMSLIFWAKVIITFRQHRQDPNERKWNLILNSTFAVLFTFAFIDLVTTIPQIIKVLIMIRDIAGG